MEQLLPDSLPSRSDEQYSTRDSVPLDNPGLFSRLQIPEDAAQGGLSQPVAQQSRAGAASNGAAASIAANNIVSTTATGSIDADEGDVSLQDGDMASLLMGIRTQWEQQQQQPEQNPESSTPPLSALALPDTAPTPRSTPVLSSSSSSAPPQGLHLEGPIDTSEELSFDAEPTVASRGSGFRPGPRALASSAGMLLSRTAGASVRTAGAGVRTAARLVGTPIAAARRRYFPIGKQYYIFPTAVAPVAAGDCPYCSVLAFACHDIVDLTLIMSEPLRGFFTSWNRCFAMYSKSSCQLLSTNNMKHCLMIILRMLSARPGLTRPAFCCCCADAAMLPPAADLSLQSLQADLDSDIADPSVNRNPLKRAAGMHRMAYHRRRIRLILGKASQEAQGPGVPIMHHSTEP